MRVGEKDVSEQAAIVARYTDLFSRRSSKRSARPRRPRPGTSASGSTASQDVRGRPLSAQLAEQDDALENAILAARVTFKGEECRCAPPQARLAVLDAYDDREQLGDLERTASAHSTPTVSRSSRRPRSSSARSPASPTRSRASRRRRRSRCASSSARRRRCRRDDGRIRPSARPRFEKLLGPDRDRGAVDGHVAYMRRLSPLESTYTKEKRRRVCLASPRPRLRHDGDPEHPPRPRGPAAEESARLRHRRRPADVVHLITRAQGGLPTTRRSCTRRATRCTTPASTRGSPTPSASSRATMR